MSKKKLIAILGIAGLTLGVSACGDSAKVHTSSEMLTALLSVSDMPTELNSTPVQWYENMRKVIAAPAAPWENTLDPYLCPEAGTPVALTKEQAQLEFTGGSLMEILLSSSDAKDLYKELDDGYKKCVAGTTPAYTALATGPKVGDESDTYKTDQGVVTIARFGKDLMILKWWVGSYYDKVSTYFPTIVADAAKKVEAL